MKVLVTGGNGFVGQALVTRLLNTEGCLPGGQTVSELVVADLSGDNLPDDDRLTVVEGSIADEAILQKALSFTPEMIFHLASIPGGAAEQNFQLGLDVNLKATLNMLEILRSQGNKPRLVFTSTIAVYGELSSDTVDDNTRKQPMLSYGAHKLIGEILIEDYSRKNWVDGRSVRLPGIVARPPAPSGLMSAFMSDIFWKLADNEPFICPVSEDAIAWWMSVSCCVDNLLHAANMTSEQAMQQRDFTLPVLHLSMKDLIVGLLQRFGEDRRKLISFEPDKKLEAIFGSYPPLDNSTALSFGFRHDGTTENLIENALKARL